MSEATRFATDETELIRELRSVRTSEGGSGHAEIVVRIRDDVIQIIETTTKRKIDSGKAN